MVNWALTTYRFLPCKCETSSVVRAYLSVWRLPSAPVLLLSGFAGRLPSAMVPLALLLMVQQQTGSYAVAGLASATLGIASAVDGARPRPAGRPPRAAADPAHPGGGLPAAARAAGRRRPRRRARRGADRRLRARRHGHAAGVRNRAGAVVAGRRPGAADGLRPGRHRDRARLRRRALAGRRPGGLRLPGAGPGPGRRPRRERCAGRRDGAGDARLRAGGRCPQRRCSRPSSRRECRGCCSAAPR